MAQTEGGPPQGQDSARKREASMKPFETRKTPDGKYIVNLPGLTMEGQDGKEYIVGWTQMEFDDDQEAMNAIVEAHKTPAEKREAELDEYIEGFRNDFNEAVVAKIQSSSPEEAREAFNDGLIIDRLMKNIFDVTQEGDSIYSAEAFQEIVDKLVEKYGLDIDRFSVEQAMGMVAKWKADNNIK